MATETAWSLFQARRANNLQGPPLCAYLLAGTAKQSGHSAAQPSLAQLILVERSKAKQSRGAPFSTRGAQFSPLARRCGTRRPWIGDPYRNASFYK
jgi:hypothetical protein